MGYIIRWMGVSWSPVTDPTVDFLHGVWGSGPSDVWAVGQGGRIVHGDDRMWSVVASSNAQTLNVIWGSGPATVWAVGEGGVIVQWNGVVWSTATSGTTQTLRGIWGSESLNDIWVVGDQGVILHHD